VFGVVLAQTPRFGSIKSGSVHASGTKHSKALLPPAENGETSVFSWAERTEAMYSNVSLLDVL
jgi:hypothetical protein